MGAKVVKIKNGKIKYLMLWAMLIAFE